MKLTGVENDQLVRVVATLMAGTAALALRWAGNAMLVLAGVLVVAEYATDLELISTGLALIPTAFWVAAWVARKSQDRIVDRVAAAARKKQ